MAAEHQHQFHTQIIELENTKGMLPRKMSSQFRLRKSVPLLGFLGKIAGPVAGMLTYDDGERYDGAIQDLNHAEANLSHFVGNKHIW